MSPWAHLVYQNVPDAEPLCRKAATCRRNFFGDFDATTLKVAFDKLGNMGLKVEIPSGAPPGAVARGQPARRAEASEADADTAIVELWEDDM